MRAKTISTILLASVLATAANAATIMVTGRDTTAGGMVTLNVNGVERNEFAGPYLLSVNGSPATFEAFCIDFFTSINTNQAYDVTIAPPSAALFQVVGQMYSTYVGNMNAASGAQRQLYGTALQIALWEVLIDGFDLSTTNDLGTGNFRASTITPFSAALQTTVTSYLTTALGPISPTAFIYQSSTPNVTMQALIGDGPTTGDDTVPEPGTWAMLGTGLVGLSILHRRNRR